MLAPQFARLACGLLHAFMGIPMDKCEAHHLDDTGATLLQHRVVMHMDFTYCEPPRRAAALPWVNFARCVPSKCVVSCC